MVLIKLPPSVQRSKTAALTGGPFTRLERLILGTRGHRRIIQLVHR